MFPSTFFVLALAAFAPSALATIYTTSPVASTSWAAGQQSTISWQDDNTTPSLKSFGPSKVSVYVGNAIQQTQLQQIASNVDVSTTSSIVFTPDGTMGGNGNDYFIRFESNSLKDATNSAYPALAFSAKFTLTGMTGQFNATVQSEIDGQSTAPIGGASTSAGSSATKAATSMTTSKASTSTTSSASKSTSSTSASQRTAVTGMAGFAAALAAVFALVL